MARSAAASAAAGAAAFSSGMFVQQSLEKVRLPQLRRAADGAPTFKLSIRVLAASVPGLDTPTCGVERQKLFIEAKLGSTKKETEFADYSRKDRRDGVCADECPWRFGDTLTFTARVEDILGKGLRLRLRVRRDVIIGPFEFTLRSEDVAEGGVDFRRRVLPACVEDRRGIGGRRSWGSPVLLVPLFHVQGGRYGAGAALGEAAAHAAVAFSIDTDPEAILACEGPKRGSFELSFNEAEEKLKRCSGVADWSERTLKILEPVDSQMACKRAEMRAWTVNETSTDIESPDLDPEGWVCRTGQKGQVYWHHRALGPAPWEEDAGSSSKSKKMKVPRGPEERPEDWVSHQGADGRTFWHNRNLGPTPWDNPQEAKDAEKRAKDQKVQGGKALFRQAMAWGK